MKQIIIVGGGIAGLVASIHMVRAGLSCMLIEKKNYPTHKVCGEYISNEALPYLKSLDLLPPNIILPQILRFQLSSVSGESKVIPLNLGGFGISRYCFDHFLYSKALEAGVEVTTDTPVEKVEFVNDGFLVTTSQTVFRADLVLGAFGKRSTLDARLNRSFIKKRSPYLGVKYHVQLDHPEDLIALHNFNGGYCGVSPVENHIVNICYLAQREKLKQFKSIKSMEENVLFQNPILRQIFAKATFILDRPETINEINFETKAPVENHLLMIGDAAGMITPLCGNGMAMAIQSAKLASTNVITYFRENGTRVQLERNYASQWNSTFRSRLWAGRQIQRLFGSESASSLAINLAVHFPPIADLLIRNTHGKPF
jgi:menaquinone-9 beta-reductase